MDQELSNVIAIHLDDISHMETLKKYNQLYKDIGDKELRELFTKLHSNITELF